MEQPINYEEKVREVYPNAFCAYSNYGGKSMYYYITTPELNQQGRCLVDGTETVHGTFVAWKYTYQTLLKQDKIKRHAD